MFRVALAVLALGLATAAAAQPMATVAAPAAGTLSPATGAQAESASFQARTPAETTATGAGCTGYMDPSAPDVVVDWGGGDLRVWVRATFDATLAVARPDGSWACDDDTEGVLPVVELSGAPAGRYAVWLGSFAPDPMDADAVLYAGTPPPRPTLDADTRPLAGTIDAAGGFEEDQGTLTVSVSAGGPDPAEALGLEEAYCTGYIDAASPTAAVSYDADGGTGVLTLSVRSDEADLVILAQGPDGTILCNDDFEGTDPLVQFQDPASGTYVVWAGTFAASLDPVGATLDVGETDLQQDFYDGEDFERVPFSEGTYVPLDLDTAPRVRIEATDADAGSVAVTIRPTGPNPVQGPSCAGYIETTPTLQVGLRGDGPFALTATGDEDLTLLVRTPSGRWYCSDDADELDPGVQVDDPEAGPYLVWVGSFGTYDEAGGTGGAVTEATVSATPGEIVVSTPDYGDFGGTGVDPQSGGEYDGSAIVVGGDPVRLGDGAATEAEVGAGGTVLNPVLGAACFGFLDEHPSALVEVGGDVLTVSATGDEDLTMAVYGPDGSWTCSDDADGSDPAATVEAGPGSYAVWVGTYYRRTVPARATLRVE